MSNSQRPPAGLVHGYAIQGTNEYNTLMYSNPEPRIDAFDGSAGHPPVSLPAHPSLQWEHDPPGRRAFTPEQRNAFMVGLLTHGNNFAAILAQFGSQGSVSNVLADFTTAHLQDKTRVMFDRAHWRGLGAGCKTYMEWVALLPRNPSLLWAVVQDDVHADNVAGGGVATQDAGASVQHYGGNAGGMVASALPPIGSALNSGGGRTHLMSGGGLDFDDSGLGGMSSTNSSARDSTPGMSTHRSHSPRLSAGDNWGARSRDRVSRIMPPPTMLPHVGPSDTSSGVPLSNHHTYQWNAPRSALAARATARTYQPLAASFPPRTFQATNQAPGLFQPFIHAQSTTVSSSRSTRDHSSDPSSILMTPELMPPPSFVPPPRSRQESLPTYPSNNVPLGHHAAQPQPPTAVAVGKDSAVASWASTVAAAASSAATDSIWSEEELIALEEGLKLHHLSNSRRPRYKFVQEMFGAQGARANVLQFRTRKEMRTKAHELIRERRVLGLPVDPYLDSDGDEDSGAADARDGAGNSSESGRGGGEAATAATTPVAEPASHLSLATNTNGPPPQLTETGDDLLSPDVDALITSLHELTNARPNKGVPKTVDGDEQLFTLAQDRALVHGLLDAMSNKHKFVWQRTVTLHGPTGSRSRLLANRLMTSLKRRAKALLTASMRRGDSPEGALKPILGIKTFHGMREAWRKKAGIASAGAVSEEQAEMDEDGPSQGGPEPEEERHRDDREEGGEARLSSVSTFAAFHVPSPPPSRCTPASTITAARTEPFSPASQIALSAPPCPASLAVGPHPQPAHRHTRSTPPPPIQSSIVGITARHDASLTSALPMGAGHTSSLEHGHSLAANAPSESVDASDQQHQLDAFLSSLLSFEPSLPSGNPSTQPPTHDMASQSLEDMLRAPMRLSNQASSLIQPAGPAPVATLEAGRIHSHAMPPAPSEFAVAHGAPAWYSHPNGSSIPDREAPSALVPDPRSPPVPPADDTSDPFKFLFS